MRKIMMCVVVLVLAGCSGAPVGWGGTDEVVFADEDTIKIQWDNSTTSEVSVRKKAVAHCANTQRVAMLVDGTSDPLTFGLIRSRTWKCKASP